MKFSKFKQNYSRKCVMFMLDPASQEQMHLWAVSQGFDLTKNFSGEDQPSHAFDFHITLIYSENEAMMPNKETAIRPITVGFSRFDELGKRDEGERGVPVLIIDQTPELVEKHDFVVDFYQLFDQWPVWLAHLSLSYFWHGTPDLASLNVPDFKITLDRIKVTEVK